MEPKKIITVILLGFVLLSGIYLLVQERGAKPLSEEEQAAVDEALQKMGRATAVEEPAYEPGIRVIAYYFHGNTRCVTCRKIEAYTYETLVQRFPNAVGSGSLEWRVVNVDEPENEHFIEDFQQTSRSVVLVNMTGGTQGEWKTLQRVWELVGNRDEFQEYIRTETAAFLESSA